MTDSWVARDLPTNGQPFWPASCGTVKKVRVRRGDRLSQYVRARHTPRYGGQKPPIQFLFNNQSKERPNMNASKENARIAKIKVSAASFEGITFVRQFLEAAERKLLSEQAYAEDKTRRSNLPKEASGV